MRKIFICSPYRGDVKKNIANVKRYCERICYCGYIPIAPHLYFTQFLDDNISLDRMHGLRMGQELLKECDEVHVFADEVTEGMINEIRIARELKIPIKFHDSEMKEVNYDTLIINTRIGSGLRKLIEDDWTDRNGFERCQYAGNCSRRNGECCDTGKEHGESNTSVK